MSKEVMAECVRDAGWAYSEGISQMREAWGFVVESESRGRWLCGQDKGDSRTNRSR